MEFGTVSSSTSDVAHEHCKRALLDDISIEERLFTTGLGIKQKTIVTKTTTTNEQENEQENNGIPIIDMSALTEQEFSERLLKACEEVGFFTIINNPFVCEQMIERQFELSKKFFERTIDAKERYSPFAAEKNSGYEWKSQVRPSTRLKDEKESFQITAKPSAMENRWPIDMSENFEDETKAFMANSLLLAKAILNAITPKAAPWLEDKNEIANAHTMWTNESQCTLRLIHYPPFETKEEADEAASKGFMRAGAHTDWCNVTLLYQIPTFGNGGLECASNPRKNGFVDTEWTAVDNTIKGAVTVNIGDMLSRWTNGRLLSNLHRVRMPVGEEALKGRYSMAFFAQADESAIIRAPNQEDLTAKDYILGRIRSNYNK
jgi:isopenicillin N synthase-like dioxygenase